MLLRHPLSFCILIHPSSSLFILLHHSSSFFILHRFHLSCFALIHFSSSLFFLYHISSSLIFLSFFILLHPSSLSFIILHHPSYFIIHHVEQQREWDVMSTWTRIANKSTRLNKSMPTVTADLASNLDTTILNIWVTTAMMLRVLMRMLLCPMAEDALIADAHTYRLTWVYSHVVHCDTWIHGTHKHFWTTFLVRSFVQQHCEFRQGTTAGFYSSPSARWCQQSATQTPIMIQKNWSNMIQKQTRRQTNWSNMISYSVVWGGWFRG